MDCISHHTGAGIGLQLKVSTGEIVEQAIRLDFLVSNNETEFEVILVKIDLTQSMSNTEVVVVVIILAPTSSTSMSTTSSLFLIATSYLLAYII